MGTQYKVGVGFGYQLPDKNFYDNFPAEVKMKLEEEGYGLDEIVEELSNNVITEAIAGNLWDGPATTFLVIKDTCVEEYTFVASFKPEQVSEGAISQLNEVLTKLNMPIPKDEPQWFVWSYVG